MGIVLRQSASNTVITYLGFGIGALNTLFLYTRFLSAEYYGLVGVILSTAAILMPLLALGVPNTMIKYYSSFRERPGADGFLTLMLLLPLAMILPLAGLSFLANESIAQFVSHKNAIVKDYVWHIFLIGVAMAYFEVFYSWSKVQLKSVAGNFMKEVFARLLVGILLFAVYTGILTVAGFLNALVCIYAVRALIMAAYALRLRPLQLNFKWPGNLKDILSYSVLIIIGGSAAVLLLELDRFMINQFIAIENVAYYSVAVFIATVIAVPLRSMHQVTYPITATLMNNNELGPLKKMYQKSSLTLYIISGFIFLLILLNMEDLYLLLPAEYRGGLLVVFLIGLARVFDAVLGINNAILFNSEYYRAVLFMGMLLAVLTILFNLWLIPVLGINGAALASLLAIGIYNSIKLYYVRQKFNMLPFTAGSWKVSALLAVLGLLFYILRLPFGPIPNILLKSTLLTAAYFGLIYRFRISDDVSGVLRTVFNRKENK